MGGELLGRFRLIAICLGAGAIVFSACSDGDDIETATPASIPPDADVILQGADGVPTILGGELGRVPDNLDPSDPDVAMDPILAQIAPMFRARVDQLRLVSFK